MRQLNRCLQCPPYKSKRVLLVDDERDLGWTMKEIMDEAGHKLTYASSFKEGMEKFKRLRNLDIAIIDLRLGNKSGLRFIKELRTINDKVTLIMISAFGSPDIKNKASRLGVSRFLDKPLRPERLLEIIEHDSMLKNKEGVRQ